MDTKTLDSAYIANTYARFSVEIISGKGSVVVDDSGKNYIDLATGIAVNTFGVSDDEWKSAVIAQLNAFSHTSNLYYSNPCAVLAQMLCTRTDMKKVFFSNSGAEANECAIKAVRKYSEDKYGAGRHVIVTLKNSFHGRTLATLSATGQDVFHKLFTPLVDGFRYGEANNLKDIESLVADGSVCAIMMEMVQGEGGVMPLEKDFVQGVYNLCKEKDILLVCDEVQCGNGRCGELYAYMNYGIKPDVFTTAKGLGGGLPLGATVLGEKLENTFTPSTHGSTFGGNPVCCAGAINILSRIDDKLLSEVKQKSAYIFDRLSNAKGVKSVSGMGLMIGIETEKDASQIVSDCIEKGVLVIKAKQKVRLLPALNIPFDILEKAIDTLISVL